MELQIKKEKTKTRAGQYIFLSCPEISYFQWHPFTLTRCVIVFLIPKPLHFLIEHRIFGMLPKNKTK